MSEINYCTNGCTRREGDLTHRITTEGKSQLCSHCEDRFHTWLTKLPDAYTLLPLFVEHGTTDRNPESKTTKATDAPAPMRLDVIDLLDTRPGRRWNGTEPTDDHRGVIGTLKPWVEQLCDERPLTTITSITVTSACQILDRHRLWIAEQDWVGDLYDDIRQLHRTVSNAVGDYRQKPVGRCTKVKDESECGGPLFPNATAGVTCARCNDHTPADRLRILGQALADQEIA